MSEVAGSSAVDVDRNDSTAGVRAVVDGEVKEQLQAKLQDVAVNRLSIDEFERWFHTNTRNVHQQGNAELLSLVFEVEGVLSGYRFDDASESLVVEQLALLSGK